MMRAATRSPLVSAISQRPSHLRLAAMLGPALATAPTAARLRCWGLRARTWAGPRGTPRHLACAASEVHQSVLRCYLQSSGCAASVLS